MPENHPWNNRYCHSSTTVHVDKKEKYLKALADAETGDKICQMRISAEALTGVNYDEGRNGYTSCGFKHHLRVMSA
jgi:hypothetical protein